MQQYKQMSETFQLGAILTCVGGFLDAYTYICRGGVFANAQTGNIVLLGINIAQLNIHESFRYLIPIVAFTAGVAIAEAIKNKNMRNKKIHWRQIIIVFEILILSIVSFLPQNVRFNTLANIMISFVCALQFQSFKKMDGNAFATTICTGNLRSATEHLCKALNLNDKYELLCGLKYVGIIIAFVIGASFGAILATAWGSKSLLIVCAGLVPAFCFMSAKYQL